MKQIAAIAVLSLMLAGCANVQTAWNKATPLERVVVGASAGALAGSAIGAWSGGPHGVAIGTAVGAVSGGAGALLAR